MIKIDLELVYYYHWWAVLKCSIIYNIAHLSMLCRSGQKWYEGSRCLKSQTNKMRFSKYLQNMKKLHDSHATKHFNSPAFNNILPWKPKTSTVASQFIRLLTFRGGVVCFMSRACAICFLAFYHSIILSTAP